ncbi:MAG: hypothetical protein H0V02_02875 [Nocardioidaceae bacterium]|nr:hypothetical protein [Nocardioidaceae bacterium]
MTIRPVIDLEQTTPVDCYEIPDRIREAAHLRSPVDVFPYATNTSRRRDLDHTEAYQDPGEGGPPGQTRLDNLGPMTRFHHRIKPTADGRSDNPSTASSSGNLPPDASSPSTTPAPTRSAKPPDQLGARTDSVAGAARE